MSQPAFASSNDAARPARPAPTTWIRFRWFIVASCMTLVVAPVPMSDRLDELRQLVAHYGNLMSDSYEQCSFSVKVSRRILTTLLRCAWAFFTALSARPKLQLRS